MSILTLKYTFETEYIFDLKDSVYISVSVFIVALGIIQYMAGVYLSKQSNEILRETI